MTNSKWSQGFNLKGQWPPRAMGGVLVWRVQVQEVILLSNSMIELSQLKDLQAGAEVVVPWYLMASQELYRNGKLEAISCQIFNSSVYSFLKLIGLISQIL